MVLDWAADEGWNPGLDDAAAFLAADPQGFFIRRVQGQPVAAISVVNHSDAFAFLGLYIVAPAFRGQGHGMAVWRAGLAHAGARCVGLDGVPAQQANYARSGFGAAGRTTRYRGTLARATGTGTGMFADPATVRQADAQATGVRRDRFAAHWFADTPTRRTVTLRGAEGTGAFATIRRCREGAKIGPFHAQSEPQARALLDALAATLPAGPVFIDLPDPADHFAAMLEGMGFVPVFETARMYCGPAPIAQPPAFYASATLELG
ncbi:MAG: N-acetyltransferase [Rhodobacteraceae bacterium]|nr:N-acetyltransferase [Paracoccaceae bacterium]